MKYFFIVLLCLFTLISNAQTDTTDAVFTRVDIEASFQSGKDGWRNYLMKNLKADVPIRNKAKSGTYTVIVQFIVDREGNVSEVKALTSHGYGMEEEVVRILNNSPKWTPAEQNGRKVKAYKKQPVTFVVADK